MLVKARAVSFALIFKFDGNGFLFLYSTAAAISPTQLLVKYLIDSLGFCGEEAIPLSAKVTRINSFKNPDLAINFFKQTGFDNTQIKTLVSEFPELLFYDVEKTLKPKLQCLSELGLSGSYLVKVVFRDWKFIDRGLDNCIKSLLSCLKNVLVSDENVVKLPYCLGLSETRIQAALAFLMKEVRNKSIYIASRPSLLAYSLEKRLIPRYEMWKLVNEKNLIKSRQEFYTLMTWNKSKFLKKYVLPVKAELPDLYDLYIKRIGK
ncbi:hypothetical protein HAX54_014663 [Datura stramonium]|uniref:Uncharacterized protein n=1 Tax=Datura stramonium TaxID=4076 RepID=A0ABS8TNH0_DATST|nr:hypothetical protein [Datura stramonium]